MADKFHAVFQPGTAIKIADTLTIAFDSPADADDVTVTLNEVDAWVSGGATVTENNGPPVLVAQFKGKIVAKRFQGTLTQKGTSTATNPPTLKVLFDGQAAAALQSIPIPDATLANEDGIFEIQLDVTGTIKKKKAKFSTPSPAFVRNFKAGQPVVAFVTGSGSGYFTAANAFMKSYADGTFGQSTVLEIREFLRTQASARGFGPWGEANVVSHGNATEWVILPKPGATNSHLRWWDIKDLQSDRAFTPSVSTELASGSKFIIRGCAIGNDQPLLDEIRTLFGGQTTVFAPKYLQYYEQKGSVAREGFYEFLFFYEKAKTAPSDADCVKALKAKYSSLAISDADWLKMLQNTTETPTGFRASHGGSVDRHETIPWRTTMNIEHKAKPRKGLNGPTPPEVTAAIQAVDFRAKAETDFNAAPPKQNLETSFSDWFWEEGSLEEKPVNTGLTSFSKLFTGHKVRVEVRRELRDAKGAPVKPDLTNSDHYGHSP